MGFHHSAILCIAFSTDGLRFATGDYNGGIKLWEAHKQTSQGPAWEGHWAAVNDLVWTNSGQFVASASADCSVIVWDVQAGVPLHVCLGHTQPALCVAVVDLQAEGGGLLVSGSEDGSVIVWDLNYATQHRSDGSSDAILVHIDAAPATSSSFGGSTITRTSPHSSSSFRQRQHTGGGGGGGGGGVSSTYSCRRDDYDDSDDDDDDEGGGGETRYLAVGHTLPVRGVALDRSARYFCSCSDDERVLIWDLSGRLLAELRGHVDAV